MLNNLITARYDSGKEYQDSQTHTAVADVCHNDGGRKGYIFIQLSLPRQEMNEVLQVATLQFYDNTLEYCQLVKVLDDVIYKDNIDFGQELPRHISSTKFTTPVIKN